jgi:hypothetical protein
MISPICLAVLSIFLTLVVAKDQAIPSKADDSSAAVNTRRELGPGHSLEDRWEILEPDFAHESLKILLTYTVNDFIADSMVVISGR